jgi:glycosyltransferase involved in cell wall biosynthesis
MFKSHVLHIVPTLKAGGMELALSRIVNGLLPEGITHSIVVLKGDPIISNRFDPSVRIHCLHSYPNDISILLRLRRLLKKESPTVIHARNLAAWPEIWLANLTIWPVAPLIFSFHGVAEAKPLPWRWRIMSQILARFTNQVFTVSQGSKRFLTDHVGLTQKQVTVIPNGVDTKRFCPLVKTSDRQEFVIGTLGSLTPVKNQALLMRACHRLIEQGINLRLEIAGEGSEKSALEQLIRDLGVSEKIQLIGGVIDTPSFLQNLDIFALPSDSEAHPNALSEAMACGLPCIASAVGGIPEILDQGQAGLIFEPADEIGLAEGLLRLINDPVLRKSLGTIARNQSCERYSMDIMLKNYRELYLRYS